MFTVIQLMKWRNYAGLTFSPSFGGSSMSPAAIATSPRASAERSKLVNNGDRGHFTHGAPCSSSSLSLSVRTVMSISFWCSASPMTARAAGHHASFDCSFFS